MNYFDNNASAPMPAAVIEGMLPYMQNPGNAASVHQAGRFMRHAIDEAKEKIAALINAHPSELIFTSGGTEAANLAILGWANTCSTPSALYIGATEHDAVLAPAQHLSQSGWTHTPLAVDNQGIIAHQSLPPSAITGSLCAVMMANNETGTIQPVSAIAEWAQAHGIVMYTDAVQAAGKMDIDMQALGVDMLSLSAHKIGGPKGVGVLVKKAHVPLAPIIHGGGHQHNLRSGTENVPGIVGFGIAAELTRTHLSDTRAHYEKLGQVLCAGMREIGVTLLADAAPRIPNTYFLHVPGIEGEMVLMMLDKAGFAVGSGSACHSLNQSASHVLEAMQVSQAVSQSTIRVSFGPQNTVAEVEGFVQALKTILEQFTGVGSSSWQ